MKGEEMDSDSTASIDKFTKERAFEFLVEAETRGDGPWGSSALEAARIALNGIPRDLWDAEIGIQFANVCLELNDEFDYEVAVPVEVAEDILRDTSQPLTLRADFAVFHLAALENSGNAGAVCRQPSGPHRTSTRLRLLQGSTAHEVSTARGADRKSAVLTCQLAACRVDSHLAPCCT